MNTTPVSLRYCFLFSLTLSLSLGCTRAARRVIVSCMPAARCAHTHHIEFDLHAGGMRGCARVRPIHYSARPPLALYRTLAILPYNYLYSLGEKLDVSGYAAAWEESNHSFIRGHGLADAALLWYDGGARISCCLLSSSRGRLIYSIGAS